MSTVNLKSITTGKVSFHDCDPLQIVWHGNYLKYFEEAREDFCKKHNISYLDAKRNGFATPVVKSECEHKLPLKYGDEFEVETTFIDTRAAKMLFEYKLFSSGKLICTGSTTQVFTDENSQLVLNNPPFYQQWKSKMGLL